MGGLGISNLRFERVGKDKGGCPQISWMDADSGWAGGAVPLGLGCIYVGVPLSPARGGCRLDLGEMGLADAAGSVGGGF